MYGAGMTSSGVFGSSPYSAIEPSLRAFGVRPWVSSVKVNFSGESGRSARVMFSFTRPGPTAYCRSAPCAASLYVTVEPFAVGFRSRLAPSRPRLTERPSGDWKRTSLSDFPPNQLRPLFVVLANS